MSIEDRLKDELDREGRRPVDVDSLYASTRERIDSGRGSRRVTHVLAVAASAVAVLGIAGGGLWLDQWQGDDRSRAQSAERASPLTEGGLDDEFRCGDTTTVAVGLWDPINVSNPRLGWKGIERYEFVPDGNSGLLRVGLADGSLTAKIQLRKEKHWKVEGAERCTGPDGSDVPVDGRFELGMHGRPFPEPPKFQPDNGEPPPDSSVQPIDDRAFYNEFGVVDRRTVFAHEDRRQVIVRTTGGELDYYEYSSSIWLHQDRLQSLESQFFYDIPGVAQQRDRDFAFLGYYTRGAGSLTAELEDGSTVDAKAIRGDDWKGTLYALLAPRTEVEKVVVERDGRTKSYQPGQIR